jgi:ribonuclease HI
MEMIKFDLITKTREFIIEKGIGIPFARKIVKVKKKMYYYYGCLADPVEYEKTKKYLKENSEYVVKLCNKKSIDIKNIYYLYNDGATLNNGKTNKLKDMYGSYAYIIVKRTSNNIRRILETFTESKKDWTNNHSELIGVIQGIKRLLEICKGKKKVHITVVTDSQYVTRGTSCWMHDWRERGWKNVFGGEVKNDILWKEMFDLLENNPQLKITFKWVKGHQPDVIDLDLRLNAECDNLASLALNKYRTVKEFRELHYVLINSESRLTNEI